ncbi:hypothetical protein CKO27_23705 [Thiocystis violacea]|nr:hypothetical protein [Thiocystis violacea]
MPLRGALTRMHGGWLHGWAVGFGHSQPTTTASLSHAFQQVGLILVPFAPGPVADITENFDINDPIIRQLIIRGVSF